MWLGFSLQFTQCRQGDVTIFRTTIYRTTVHRTTVYRNDSSLNRQLIEQQFIEPTVHRTDSLSNRQFTEPTVYRTAVYRTTAYQNDSLSFLIKLSTGDLNAHIQWNNFYKSNEFCHRNTQGVSNAHFNHIHSGKPE